MHLKRFKVLYSVASKQQHRVARNAAMFATNKINLHDTRLKQRYQHIDNKNDKGCIRFPDAALVSSQSFLATPTQSHCCHNSRFQSRAIFHPLCPVLNTGYNIVLPQIR
jgi:hypothetical protein